MKFNELNINSSFYFCFWLSSYATFLFFVVVVRREWNWISRYQFSRTREKIKSKARTLRKSNNNRQRRRLTKSIFCFPAEMNTMCVGKLNRACAETTNATTTSTTTNANTNALWKLSEEPCILCVQRELVRCAPTIKTEPKWKKCSEFGATELANLRLANRCNCKNWDTHIIYLLLNRRWICIASTAAVRNFIAIAYERTFAIKCEQIDREIFLIILFRFKWSAATAWICTI